MKKIIIPAIITLLLVAVIVVWASSVLPNFFTSFLANAVGGVFTALIFTIFISYYLEKVNRPDLEIQVQQSEGNSDKIFATTGNDEGNYEIKAEIVIKNKGNLALNAGEGYWHLYLPEGLHLCRLEANGNLALFHPTEISHYKDKIELSIFPESYVSPRIFIIGTNIRVKAEYFIYWFINSKYGRFPKSATHGNENGLLSDDALQTLGILPVIFPNGE